MSQSHHVRRQIKAASERGKRMEKARWERDRAQRDRLANLTAEQFHTRIVRRIVVIDNETTVRETTIWTFDSARSARRKVRSVLLSTTTNCTTHFDAQATDG